MLSKVMSHRLDYRAIRAKISIIQVLDLIGYLPTSCRGGQWRGPCPFSHSSGNQPHGSESHRSEWDHSEADRSQSSSHGQSNGTQFPKQPTSGSSNHCFSVNTSKNAFRCFCCKRSGNALDLWAKLTRKPLYPATLDLCQKLRIFEDTENSQPENSV